MPSLPRKPTRVRNSHPSQQLLRCAHFPRLRGFFCPQVLVRAVGAVGLDVSPLRRDFGCPTPDGLTRFWGARPVTHSLFTEDRAVGMETSVPQRPPLGPLTSTENLLRVGPVTGVEKAGMANCEAPRPAEAGAQAGERRAIRNRGRLSSGGRLVSGDRRRSWERSSGRSAWAHVRPAFSSPPGRAPSHGRPPGFRVPAVQRLPRSVPTTRQPDASLRAAPGCAFCQTALTSHLESDTWKRKIRNTGNTDPHPRLCAELQVPESRGRTTPTSGAALGPSAARRGRIVSRAPSSALRGCLRSASGSLELSVLVRLCFKL